MQAHKPTPHSMALLCGGASRRKGLILEGRHITYRGCQMAMGQQKVAR